MAFRKADLKKKIDWLLKNQDIWYGYDQYKKYQMIERIHKGMQDIGLVSTKTNKYDCNYDRLISAARKQRRGD